MSEPNPNTGAVGSTGATAGGAPTVSSGSGTTTPPKHPTQVPNPNAKVTSGPSKGKVWNETPQGAQLQTGYAALHDTFTTQLPAARRNLQALQRRPLKG